MILITHIVILTILGLDIAAFCIIFGRRYYTSLFQSRLNRERERCAEMTDSLGRGTEFTAIGLLRREPGSIGWKAVEGELFKALTSPEANKEYIRLLFDLLGYIRHYTDMLKGGKAWEQASAIERLGRLRCAGSEGLIIKALVSHKRDVRNMAAYSLGELKGQRAAKELIKQLRRVTLHNEESSIRIIKSALIACGDPALNLLLPELKNSKWRVRAAVVDILAQSGSASVIQPLIDMLKDPERDVRAKAAKGLGKIKDISAVPPLALLTKTTDRFWVVRLHVVRALGLIKDPIAIETIKARLGDNKWPVRSAAATALGTIGSTAYLVLVEQYLRSKDQYAREQAKEELATSGIIDSFVGFILKNRDRLPANGNNRGRGETGKTERPKPLINGGAVPPAVYIKMADLLVASGPRVPAEVIINMTSESMGKREQTTAIEILRTLNTGSVLDPYADSNRRDVARIS